MVIVSREADIYVKTKRMGPKKDGRRKGMTPVLDWNSCRGAAEMWAVHGDQYREDSDSEEDQDYRPRGRATRVERRVFHSTGRF